MNRTNYPTTTKSTQQIQNIDSIPIIRDVWEDNFDEEFRKIMKLADQYKWIAMENSNMEYRTMKANVDQLKCIQVGISFCDDQGQMPPGVSTWQFNLKFDKEKDTCSHDSLELLTNSGIQFDKHATNGVSAQLFAEYLISSGLLLNEDISWVCFHGGFDFGYLIKMINTIALPNTESEFNKLLTTYFPAFYDLKYLVRDIDGIKMGGLSKLAADLNVKRIGPQHQAGSDALLTLAAFMKLREMYFKNSIDMRYKNVLYGINSMDTISDYSAESYVTFDYNPMMYGDYTNGMPLGMFHSQPTPIFAGLTGGNYNYSLPYVGVPYTFPQAQFVETPNTRTRKPENFNGKK